VSERDPRALDALLDALLDAEGVERSASTSIPRRGATRAPLSPSQRQLWFLEELEPEAHAYNIVGAVLLRGSLDADALEAAIAGVVDRHEALRTTFESRDGDPVQVIRAAMRIPLERARGDASRPEAEAARVAAEMARRPWNLSRGPLLRSTLVDLGPGVRALTLAMHHIVADGWSIGVLLREIAAFYAARRQGRAPGLDPLPIQYADLAAWQIERLASGEIAPQIEYWKHALGAAVTPLDLPSDRPRVAVPKRRGASIRFVVEGNVAEGVVRAARAAAATPYAAWLACFEAVVARFAERTDFTVGSPIAGRGDPETANLIGILVNSLPVRADLSGDPSLREIVTRARDASRAVLSNADAPFDMVVEAVRAPRVRSINPLFQVMFAYQEEPVPLIALPGIDAAMVDVDDGSAKFDLTLSVDRYGDRFEGSVEYDAGLFDPGTADRLVAQIRRVAAALAAGGQTRLSRLDLLGDAERHAVVTDANATDRPFDRSATVASLFEAQARRTPEAVAVVAKDGRATYAELEARAGRLGGALRAEGVGPETPVGVCLGRHVDMIAALLAVLKSGGACVPLDPASSAERLAFMIEDSRCRMVLTETAHAAALPATTARTILVDRLDPTVGPGSGEPAAAGLSHIFYTSGSTGRPRGVAIEHRSVTALLAWGSSAFAPDQRAGVLASTSIGSSLSLLEVFLPLVTGGKVILAESPLDLPSLSAAAEVTLVSTAPAVFDRILRAGPLPPSVRTICLAGEPLPASLVERAYAEPGVREVYNLYGQTEGTTVSTLALVPPGDSRAPSIGRPIDNVRACLLDETLEPAPIGYRGEIFVSGEGLARGYVSRPDLTADRFVPDPFAATPGARMHRSGDLGRRRPDGSIEFLGRVDEQIKVTGLRVETTALEDALRRHPSVVEAAVVARREGADGRLTAFVVTKAPRPTPTGLRRHLEATPAATLIPSSFVAIDALPLLAPGGKVDRAALTARGELAAGQERLFSLARRDPDGDARSLVGALRLEGPLDAAALAEGFREVVRRHETLRVRFEKGPDGPDRVLGRAEEVVLALDDLETWPAADREREAARRAGEEARRTFDLAKGPLIRGGLLRLSAEDHVLVVAVHRVASIGSSVGLLLSELRAVHAALVAGGRSRLPGICARRADGEAWRRGRDAEKLERQLAWWREELLDLPDLSLPGDRPRPVRAGKAEASLGVRIEKDLADRLACLARAEGATIRAVLLAAFAGVLSRWSGQRDFGVATPSGELFADPLVVRVRLDRRRALYRDLLRAIRESELAAAAHRDVPLDRIVEAVCPDLALSRAPFARAMLVLTGEPPAALDLGGMPNPDLDLTLSLAATGDTFDGSIRYSAELFDEATIHRLWDHLTRLLATVAGDPAADIDTVRLLDDEETARALDSWSGRAAVRESARPIHERFLARAAAAPGSIAAILGARRVTYGALADRSGRLAARLIEAGVKPEERVGIVAQRSPELLTAMMAVWRAGGAYVPIDPDHPRDRADYCLTDSGARVVLATADLVSLASGGEREVIVLDDDGSFTSDPLDRSPDPGPGALGPPRLGPYCPRLLQLLPELSDRRKLACRAF